MRERIRHTTSIYNQEVSCVALVSVVIRARNTEIDAEVSVLRNAGGKVTDDVLRSAELISTVGGVGMVAVIHHTGLCSTISFRVTAS